LSVVSASNALTITLNPCTLVFRSSTLTSGAAVSLTVPSAITLTIPSGATLGSTSGVSSRYAILAINNVGTVELAVVNGTSFDESGLLTTLSMSTSANTAGSVYSATSRASVTYRVVGFFDSLQTTAGTWASNPSTVHGSSSPLKSSGGFGVGQTWQDVTASRANNTTYTNSSGKPILVQICFFPVNSSSWSIQVDGVDVSKFGVAGYVAQETLYAIVPNGSTYLFNNPASGSVATVAFWKELR